MTQYRLFYPSFFSRAYKVAKSDAYMEWDVIGSFKHKEDAQLFLDTMRAQEYPMFVDLTTPEGRRNHLYNLLGRALEDANIIQDLSGAPLYQAADQMLTSLRIFAASYKAGIEIATQLIDLNKLIEKEKKHDNVDAAPGS